MGFSILAAKLGAGAAGSPAGKAAASLMGRSVIGGIAGGIYGAATGNYDAADFALGSIGKGILTGAAIGAGLPAAFRGVAGASKYALKKSPTMGWKGVKAAWKTGRFTMRHPMVVAGTIAGGVGAYYGMSRVGFDSPTLSNQPANYNPERMGFSLGDFGMVNPSGMAGAPTNMMRPYMNALMRSTDGMVQGLWANRHG